jgi:hypothetical protein
VVSPAKCHGVKEITEGERNLANSKNSNIKRERLRFASRLSSFGHEGYIRPLCLNQRFALALESVAFGLGMYVRIVRTRPASDRFGAFPRR